MELEDLAKMYFGLKYPLMDLDSEVDKSEIDWWDMLNFAQYLIENHLCAVHFSRDEAEEFLQSKDIWHHPYISDRQNKNSYEVAGLIAEFANTHKPKPQ